MASRCCVCECGKLKKLTAWHLLCPCYKFVWCLVQILCQDTGNLMSGHWQSYVRTLAILCQDTGYLMSGHWLSYVRTLAILCQDTGYLNWDLMFSSLPPGKCQDCSPYEMRPQTLLFLSLLIYHLSFTSYPVGGG